jgi:integrase
VLRNYLLPAFGHLPLRDLTTFHLQKYFSGLVTSPLSRESRDKIRDVMSAVMGTALRSGFLAVNSMDGVRLLRQRRGKLSSKHCISHAQFDQLVALIPEPYATMMYVAIYTGLRVSD